MDIPSARTFFPGTRDRAFLDAASVGLMPVQARDALQRLADDLVQVPTRDTGAHHLALGRTAGAARREAAKLIGANSADIALIENTTQGLEILAATIPLARGDRVLVGETEYLGVATPWLPKRETDGILVDVVRARDGRLLVDEYARAIDGRTRLILLSSVQWSNGYRCDLGAFLELARKHNILLVIDAIQQLGAVRFEVTRTPVDFVVCGGHKWLNAPAGRGFMWLNPASIDRLLPPPRGYLNIETPAKGWSEYFATPSIPAVADYNFVRGARACEAGGFSNVAGNVVLATSVGLINELGVAAVEQHILRLTDLLIDGVLRAGAMIVTPPERACRSGIVTFTLGEGPERDRALLQRLLDERVVLSQRYTAGVGGLRASVHFFNDEDDVKRLADGIAAR